MLFFFLESSEILANLVNSWTKTHEISHDEQQDKDSWTFTLRMLLHAHLTSYQEPQGRRPRQRLTHSALRDATEDLLATSANAFRFPFGVVRWHGMTFGTVLLFPDAKKQKAKTQH